MSCQFLNSKVVSTLLLLIGLFFLMETHPQAQVTAPPFITCRNGGMIWMDPLVTTSQVVYHCVDPAFLKAPPITGSVCTAPAAGVTIYTQLPSGLCLPLLAVPAAGGVASAVTGSWGETAMNGQPVEHYQSFFVDVTPAIP